MNQILVIIAGILAIVIVGLQIMQYFKDKESISCPVIPPCPACPSCPACQPCHPCPPCQMQRQQQHRDRRVLSDPLYPPLNRSVDMMQEDSFRLVGYLSNQNENWKLFGRMKDRHQGEYYIIPADNNLDLKIPLTQDVVVGERLRDIYNLPQEMKFKSPMLKSSTYIMTEIPKGDLGSSYY